MVQSGMRCESEEDADDARMHLRRVSQMFRITSLELKLTEAEGEDGSGAISLSRLMSGFPHSSSGDCTLESAAPEEAETVGATVCLSL